MSITKEEIKKTWDDLVSLKKRIEDEWAQGKRDMMRANILGNYIFDSPRYPG